MDETSKRGKGRGRGRGRGRGTRKQSVKATREPELVETTAPDEPSKEEAKLEEKENEIIIPAPTSEIQLKFSVS